MTLKAGDTLDLAPMGFSILVLKGGEDTAGAALEMEMTLAPGSSGTPIHVHPSALETYEVLAGAFEVYIDGEWKPVKTGERVGVPRGMPHSFRNPHAEPARVYNTHKPALRYADYFEGLWRISQSGMVKPGVKNWQTILALSALLTAYPEEIRSVSPPNAVVQVLGALGNWLGYGP